jgi:hypothetical protein
MRNAFAVTLVVLGALLCFPASAALWEQRTLASEAEFVALGRDIYKEPPVQDAIGKAIADEIAKYAGVRTVTVRTVRVDIEDIAFEVVKSFEGSEVVDVALKGVYETSRRLADIEDETVQREGDNLVIDLRPTLRSVIERADDEEPLLQSLGLPEDAGLITIADAKNAGIALDAWRAIDTAAPFLIVLPLVPFAIALIVASGRGFILFLIGALVAGGAALRIFLLRGPVDSAIEDLITGESVYGAAGVSVYQRIVNSYTSMDVMVLIGGVVVAAVGLLTSVVMARRW